PIQLRFGDIEVGAKTISIEPKHGEISNHPLLLRFPQVRVVVRIDDDGHDRKRPRRRRRPRFPIACRHLTYYIWLCVMQCRDGRRPSNASIFTGGFVLGGIVVGTLACVYAPQVLKVISLVTIHDLFNMFHVVYDCWVN
ncbi:hypothetical protein BHE74_00031533, partial [Ensete ventricosum]